MKSAKDFRLTFKELDDDMLLSQEELCQLVPDLRRIGERAEESEGSERERAQQLMRQAVQYRLRRGLIPAPAIRNARALAWTVRDLRAWLAALTASGPAVARTRDNAGTGGGGKRPGRPRKEHAVATERVVQPANR